MPLEIVASYPGAGTAINRSRALIEFIKLTGLACFAGCGFLIGGSQSRLRVFLRTFVVTSGVYSAAALVSFELAPDSLMGFWPKDLFHDRLTASFLSANTAGTFFGIVLIVALSELVRPYHSPLFRIGRSFRIPTSRALSALAVVILSTICLLQTASRGAAFATGLSAIMLLVAESRMQRWPKKIVFGVFGPIGAGCISILIATSGTRMLSRVGLVAQESVSRRDIYTAHWALIKLGPAYGYGMGSFEDLNRRLISPANLVSLWNVRAMHNAYLQWLEQSGVIGTTLMVTAILSLLLIGATSPAKRSYSQRAVSRLACGVTFVLAIHGLSDFALEDLAISGLWAVFLGLAAANSGAASASTRFAEGVGNADRLRSITQ